MNNNYIDKNKLKEDIGKAIDQAQEKASSQYQRVKGQAGEQFEHAKKKYDETRERTDKYVKENPEKSIFMAAGIGFLLGVLANLFTRRKRRKYRDYDER